jgi:SAM-dependent methyltransferase
MSTLAIDQASVVREISPDDKMFDGNEDFYFAVGRSALDCIGSALRASQVPAANVRRILDLPCGHGRVLRHLRSAFPEAELTACDLLRAGVDFCAATFGAAPVYATEDPAAIAVSRDAFDLIWVGSLLTHLDAPRWSQFLDLFRRCLRPGGVLVFSAHGRNVYDRTVRGGTVLGLDNYGMPYWRSTIVRYRYERTGFGYGHYHNKTSYGQALASPAWVFPQLARVHGLRVVHFAEAAWSRHHDVYACVRDPAWRVHHPPTSALKFVMHSIRERVWPRFFRRKWS